MDFSSDSDTFDSVLRQSDFDAVLILRFRFRFHLDSMIRIFDSLDYQFDSKILILIRRLIG